MNPLINDFLTALNALGVRFCGYAGSMFIQSGVLVVLLLFVDFLIRKRVRAMLRYWIWMLVFVKLILPPSLSLPTGIGYWRSEIPSAGPLIVEQETTPVQYEPPQWLVLENLSAPVEAPQPEPIQTIPEQARSVPPVVSHSNPLKWQAIVLVLWLVGVMIFSVLLLQRIVHVRRLIGQSKPMKNRFIEMLNQCSEQVGIRPPVAMRLSNDVSSPAVCGFFKPVILMPTTLIEKLSTDKLRAVLIHELCHIRRGDLWINSAQTILQIIYFYNPLVWLANVIVRRIREQAVDEMVLVTLGNGAQDYSNTLIDVAETAFLKTNLSLRLIGVVESKKALEGRIKHMVDQPIAKSARLGVLGLMTVLIFGAILLPMARAQKQSNENTAVDSDTQPQHTSESAKVDIAIEDKDIEVIKLSDRLFQVTIPLRNRGSVPIPRFRVNFCAGDPDKGGRLLSAQAAGPIMPGDTWREYNPGLKLEPGENIISVVVDPDNQVDESDETNNKASQDVSKLASESENVPKVGAIEKVNLAGDDILQIEAREAKGFNFPFYLFIPGGIDRDKPVYMFVETNNSGTTSDDLDFHRVKALKLAERSYANEMARRLGTPLLVPTFPRPRTNWQAYTHALDIDTLEIQEGRLKRIDLQLTAMIKYAQELLRFNGFKINEKVFMHGFSASAKFVNRYSFLHPEMVKAVAAGGVNGLPTLPVREWNGCELPFPIGIAGIERFTDGPFNEEAFRRVAHYIYMGSADKNDTLPSRDAWREGEADIIKKALAEKMMPDRWELTQEIYNQQKLPAQFVTYDGVGHTIRSQMQDDVVNFFKANSGENYAQIKPYEYPSAKVEEERPKHETGSARIDIKPEDFEIRYDKSRGTCRLRVAIHNTYNIVIPAFKLRFYRGDPRDNLDETGNVQKGWYGAGPIQPGKWWGENTLDLHLPDGQYEFTVVLDFDNDIAEIDENNNRAVLKVKLENGRLVDQSATYPITGNPPKARHVEADTLSKQTTQKETITQKRSGIDIKPANFGIRFDESRESYGLVVEIQNNSSLTIPRLKLRFYRGVPDNNVDEAGNVHRGWNRAGPLEPSQKWSEGTPGFHLPDGQYEFTVVLDFDNSISETDESNNQATLKVKIENGRIADKSVICPSKPKGLKTDVKIETKGIPARSELPAKW
jgi:beta-lactamase regulating signal transducer with metallopeptidase domain